MKDTNKSFDDWYAEESPFKGNENNEDCKWASKFMQQAYEAGQQSKQAEIDNLKKSFGVCCSSARDISDAYYQGRFVLVNERDLERFL